MVGMQDMATTAASTDIMVRITPRMRTTPHTVITDTTRTVGMHINTATIRITNTVAVRA